jgi:carboxyl-terminal processing protease
MQKMTLLLSVLTALMTIGAPIAFAGAAPLARAMTEDEIRINLESFDYVWRTIYEKHFDAEFGGLNWPDIRDEMRPRVERASTTDEARAVMQEMLMRLEQSHFNIIPAHVYEAMDRPEAGRPVNGRVGIDVRVIDGQALVISVVEGGPADDAGVRPGWEILRVGEDDVRVELQVISREFEGSPWRDAILAGAVHSRLRGRIGDSITVIFGDAAGAEVERRLTRGSARGREVRLGYLPPLHVWFQADRVEGNIGYIAFNLFLDPVHLMPAFNAAMESFLDADGIIIDVRGNSGGLPAMAMGMVGWLVAEKRSRLGTVYTRDNELKLVANPRARTFSGPVVVLVDGLSGSAAEFFAAGLKDIGRARIIGSRTSGGVLASVIERLPNGDGFQYAFAEFVSANGVSLEGRGVEPHMVVSPSRIALLEERDPALETAVTWIREEK